MYNYQEEIKNDIINNLDNFASPDALSEHLYNLLINDDSVTGNASGSYTFNRLEAKENVIDNINILWEAVGEFGISAEEVGEDFLSGEWEKFDVTIRCYLLGECIAEAIEELGE